MKITDAKKLIDDLFEKYQNTSDETLPNISLEGNTIKKALSSQISIMISWESLFAEVKYMQDAVTNEEENAFSDAVKKELIDSHKKNTITEAKEFAKCNPSYREWKAVRIDITNLMHEVKAILEVVQSRKYILNNMASVIVSSQENHII